MPPCQSASAALLAIMLALSSGVYAISRSPVTRAEFQRANPCPATDQRRGPCPGYQIDHVTPLKCGGQDSAYNMQWLSIEDHKAKTRREVRLCRRPH